MHERRSYGHMVWLGCFSSHVGCCNKQMTPRIAVIAIIGASVATYIVFAALMLCKLAVPQ